jgi:hypothetical protein
MMRNLRKRTLLPLLTLWLATAALADTTVKHLAPGVTLTQEIDQKTPLIINVVTVDLTAPGVRLGVGIGQDKITGSDGTAGREDVSRLARRWGALAAINADFFPFTGDPLGVGIRNGELFSEPFLGIGKGGPRVTLGVTPDGKGILFDNLGFLGDLQVSDGRRALINGINRPAGKNEMVVYTSLYGPETGNQPGGVEAVVRGVNLPVRANKLITGRVESVRLVEATTELIPSDGVVISGGPGTGADFLTQHLHPGEPVSFVLAVAPTGETRSAFQIAALPRTGHDLPSRAGSGISRNAWLWAQVPQAVGGGPRLLVNGQIAVDWASEGFDAGFAGSLHPRTAVGTTRDGHHLLIVTVDGRQAFSKGVSLADMAAVLKRYGAWSAINLDGGGSTAMAIGGLTVNNPSGGGAERPVADMLLVYSDRAFQADAPALPVVTTPVVTTDVEAAQEGPSARLLVPTAPVRLGQAVPLRVWDKGHPVSGASSEIVWQGPATGGIGFVNQQGYFIPLNPGTGTVSALFGGQVLTASVTVSGPATPAAFYTLQPRLVPDPDGFPRHSQLVVRITDQYGKPLGNAVVTLLITGGIADRNTLQTDMDGSATVGISWTAEKGGTVRVSSGTRTPVTITRP